MGCIGKCIKSMWTTGSMVDKFVPCPFSPHLIVCFTRKAFQRLRDKSEPVRGGKSLKWLNAENARKASNITLECRRVSLLA
jgi:hypothetical protein